MSADLRRRIEDFSLDGPGSPDLPFAARLAREHGWNLSFACRVIREYKRFVYLAMTAGRPVCPSEQVDAAWHLHLTYTRSYWKRFCGEVLGQPLHHEPTKGGQDEAAKHRTMYEGTLAAYREAFGEEPPADIWSPAEQRFGDDIKHVVVNTRQNWVIPKVWVRRTTVGAVAAGLCMTLAPGCQGDPFELKGTDYFSFLIPLAVFALIFGLVVRSWNKGSGFPAGESPPDLNWQHAAYLSGGTRRLLSATIAHLIQSGAAQLSTSGKRVERVGGPPVDDHTRVELEVLAALPLANDDHKAMKQLAERVEIAWADEARDMQDDGLTFPANQALVIGFLTGLPLIGVILGAGVTRLVVGLTHGKPSAYLILFLVVAAVVAFVLVYNRPFRTRRGDQSLDKLMTRHGLLKHGRTWSGAGDAAMAVAIFGTAALAGTVYNGLHGWYPTQSSGAGGWSSGCGSGCGGGDGGGGGGCGGCGGGD